MKLLEQSTLSLGLEYVFFHLSVTKSGHSRQSQMRLDKGIHFNQKGNKKEHTFNEEVNNKIESATKTLQATPPTVDKEMKVLIGR